MSGWRLVVGLGVGSLTPGLVADYAAVGVTELVVSWSTGDVRRISEELAAFASGHEL
ncbi:hypothetical protein [Candidatus Poriferisodalis sp.]|uniref:hypothetical protein n=1 Tax=Candidatus Poriferisodalis sp. TaxID=3101277 RepID=UPI003B0107FA